MRTRSRAGPRCARRRKGSASASGSAARSRSRCRWSAVEVPAARLKRPAAFGDLFSDDRYERVSRALGKAYRDVVRGFRGEFDAPPDLVARPARRVGDRDRAELGRGGGRGGGPLRRRHQRRRRGRGAAGRAAGGDAGPAAPRPRARGRPRLAGGADPGRGDRAAAGGAAARARPHPAPLPAVLRVLDPGRLDRDPRRRSLRDAADPHRRPGRVGAGDHPAGDLGEPAAAGLGRRSLARPDADRLGGDPRGDRRGLGAGAPAARVQGLRRGRVRRLPRRRRRRARDRPVGPQSRRTAACSTPPRRS